MKKNNALHRLLILGFMLLAMIAMPTSQASAMLVKCRVDPHFMLSNGDMVTVTLDVSTDVANISKIHYILHVPAGVTVTKVTYTAKTDRRAINETYAVYQDSPAKTYTTDTIVTTHNPGSVGVTVYTRANGINEKSVSGYSGQHLVTTISRR